MLVAVMVSGEPDVGELLGASLPNLVPERVVEVASARAGCPVAVYVLDVEGSFALRLAGDVERFPERIRAPVGVGPEIVAEALPQLRGLVIARVGPCGLWPMVVRDRVMGFLLARDRPAIDLEALAGQAGLALELASGYTDAVDAVRRRKDTQPAAEIQQNLLPPRLARVDRAEVAGGVLPGYDVGGDFFETPAMQTVCGWSSRTRPVRAIRRRRCHRWRSVLCGPRVAAALDWGKPRGWSTRRS
jgi:hypothetical protein